MKMNWKQPVFAGLMGLLVPGMIWMTALAIAERQKLQEPVLSVSTTSAQTENTADTIIRIPVLMKDGSITDVDLETYLTGVVLAEMPVSFEPEAHKAQAVVARTYTLRRMNQTPKHSEAVVCTNPACCQAYLSEAEFLEKGGSPEDISRVREEIEKTKGKVLLYNGELIDATYFSCSGGMTENALAVWGTDIPYLQSTSSPGEEQAAHFEDRILFDVSEFCSRLETELSGSPENWIGEITYTEGGGVAQIQIGDVIFKGTTVRQLLGLRSTAFTIEADSDKIMVTTKGFGHRVGMSQYGANAMALEGKNYQQILMHYYADTELRDYYPD